LKEKFTAIILSIVLLAGIAGIALQMPVSEAVDDETKFTQIPDSDPPKFFHDGTRDSKTFDCYKNRGRGPLLLLVIRL